MAWWFLVFSGANLHPPQDLVFSVNTPGARLCSASSHWCLWYITPVCLVRSEPDFTLFSPTSNSLFCFSNKTWQPHKSYICRGKAKDTNNMHRLQSFKQERRLKSPELAMLHRGTGSAHSWQEVGGHSGWKVSCQERVQVTFHAILKPIQHRF